MSITEKKKLNLLRIEKARLILGEELSRGVITDKDIAYLLRVNPLYGLKTGNKIYNYKKNLLIDIFNSPFILLDQYNLSIDIKKVLPIILNTRYNMEFEQLNYYFNEGYISNTEYEEQKQLLKYCYYESSYEGKRILKDNELYNKVKVR